MTGGSKRVARMRSQPPRLQESPLTLQRSTPAPPRAPVDRPKGRARPRSFQPHGFLKTFRLLRLLVSRPACRAWSRQIGRCPALPCIGPALPRIVPRRGCQLLSLRRWNQLFNPARKLEVNTCCLNLGVSTQAANFGGAIQSRTYCVTPPHKVGHIA